MQLFFSLFKLATSVSQAPGLPRAHTQADLIMPSKMAIKIQCKRSRGAENLANTGGEEAGHSRPRTQHAHGGQRMGVHCAWGPRLGARGMGARIM